MISRANLEVIQVLITLTGSTFLMIPQRLRGLGEVYLVRSSKVQQAFMLFWRWIMYFSIVITFRLEWSNFYSPQKNITVILFHGLVFIIKSATTCFLLAFQRKHGEIKIILHSILNNHEKLKCLENL